MLKLKWSAIVAAGLLAALSRGAPASEDSQRLTARGEVAYQGGRFEEAEDLFAVAVAKDPDDPDAHYGLGLALGKLGRWDEAEREFERALALRPDFDEAARARDLARGAAAHPTHETAAQSPEVVTRKRWELRAATGIRYDSNVTLTPRGPAGEGMGRKNDGAFLFGASGHYDFLERVDALLRLEYDFYQTLHLHLDDFDFQSHRVRGTGSYRLHPSVWAGLQGGYNYYLLGAASYLGEPFVTPFLSVLQGERGLTQILYRYGEDTFLAVPFHDVRDGPNDTAGVNQTVYFTGGQYVLFGYAFRSETPRRSIGNDYALNSNQGFVGGGFPTWWQIYVDLMYLYRADDYTHLNSFTDFTEKRQDSYHQAYVGLSRPINEHVQVSLDYYGTWNGSNISVFDYQRNVVSAIVEVRY